MTRVNLVPVRELCDQHLLAELREIKRIPNKLAETLASGKRVPPDPGRFTVRLDAEPWAGSGHTIFFYYRLGWLGNRYRELYDECLRRGFRVNWLWPGHRVDGSDPWSPSSSRIFAVPASVTRDALRIQLDSPDQPWVPTARDVRRSRQRVHETLNRFSSPPRFTPPKKGPHRDR